jgi:hypothetical protein
VEPLLSCSHLQCGLMVCSHSIELRSAPLPYFLPAQPLDDTSIIAISALAFTFYIICLVVSRRVSTFPNLIFGDLLEFCTVSRFFELMLPRLDCFRKLEKLAAIFTLREIVFFV